MVNIWSKFHVNTQNQLKILASERDFFAFEIIVIDLGESLITSSIVQKIFVTPFSGIKIQTLSLALTTNNLSVTRTVRTKLVLARSPKLLEGPLLGTIMNKLFEVNFEIANTNQAITPMMSNINLTQDSHAMITQVGSSINNMHGIESTLNNTDIRDDETEVTSYMDLVEIHEITLIGDIQSNLTEFRKLVGIKYGKDLSTYDVWLFNRVKLT